MPSKRRIPSLIQLLENPPKSRRSKRKEKRQREKPTPSLIKKRYERHASNKVQASKSHNMFTNSIPSADQLRSKYQPTYITDTQDGYQTNSRQSLETALDSEGSLISEALCLSRSTKGVTSSMGPIRENRINTETTSSGDFDSAECSAKYSLDENIIVKEAT